MLFDSFLLNWSLLTKNCQLVIVYWCYVTKYLIRIKLASWIIIVKKYKLFFELFVLSILKVLHPYPIIFEYCQSYLYVFQLVLQYVYYSWWDLQRFDKGFYFSLLWSNWRLDLQDHHPCFEFAICFSALLMFAVELPFRNLLSLHISLTFPWNLLTIESKKKKSI